VEHNLFLAPGEGDIADGDANDGQPAKSNLKNADALGVLRGEVR
jgi:hypothetical protein